MYQITPYNSIYSVVEWIVSKSLEEQILFHGGGYGQGYLQGYLQLKLSPESQRLCGIETPHASFTYQFMPLGLVSSGFE